jgi:hypothetical protein
MNRTLSTLILAAMLIGLAAGCSGPTAAGEGSDPGNNNQPAINRDALNSYSADFTVQFKGTASWIYQLKNRRSDATHETTLHIEGVQSAQNPGDIRLLTDGARTWMKGPGTDDECITFPNGQGMDPTFIQPEALVSLASLGGALKNVGEEKVGGVATWHFHAEKVVTGPWSDATIDIWQAKDTGMLYRFTMQAAGDDPFFQGGTGALSAEYAAGPLGEETIAPVEGCDLGISLPGQVSMFVRLPGMASFESTTSPQEIIAFYQSTLPEQNWVETEPPAQAENATILSYHRDADNLEIHVETAEGGSIVKVLFIK